MPFPLLPTAPLEITQITASDTAAISVAETSALPPTGPAFVKIVGQNSQSTTGTTLVITLTGAVPVGDLIVLGLTGNGNGSLTSVTDTKGNTWTLDNNSTSTTGGQVASTSVTTALVAGNTITITGTTSITSRQAIAAQFTNMATTAPFDKLASTSGTSTAPNSGNTTTTAQNNEIVVGFIEPVTATAASITAADATFTEIASGDGAGSNRSIKMYYKTVSTPGTYSMSGTLSTSVAWRAVAITYKGADATAPVPSLTWLWTGTPASNGITVSGKAPNGTSFRMKVSTTADLLTAPVFSTAVGKDANSIIKPSISGLSAGTKYYYGIEVDGVMATNTGSFKTAPTVASNFTFAFSSCNLTDQASTAYQRALNRNPDLFVHTGDLHYADIATNDQSLFRAAYDRQFAKADAQSALFAKTPTIYTWSDHDFGGNNSVGTAVAGPAAQATYRQVVPSPALPSATDIYHTFVYGRVRFIVTDCRSNKSAQAATDDATKTILGATQKQWLKDTITAAAEPLILWVADVPWTDAAAPDDEYANYNTERQELANFITASGKKVVYVHGDSHIIGANDGSVGSPGNIPVIAASALYQNASRKGTYTSGPFPATGTAIVQQYGFVSITDDGSTVTLNYTGYDDNDVAQTSLTVQAQGTASISASDTSAISVTESTARAVNFASTDTAAVSVADTSAVFKQISASDTAAISVTETRNVASTLPGTETSAVSVTETKTISVTQPTTETAAVSVADTSAVLVTQTRTDTGAISVSDVANVNKPITASDTTAVSVNETVGFSQTAVPGNETTAIGVTEQATIFVTLVSNDTTALSLVDFDLSGAATEGSDDIAITVTETASVFGFTPPIDITASDTAAVGIIESVVGMPYADDFNRPDSLTLAPGWATTGVALQIIGNQVYSSATAATSASRYTTPLYGRQVAQVTFLGGQNNGVCVAMPAFTSGTHAAQGSWYTLRSIGTTAGYALAEKIAGSSTYNNIATNSTPLKSGDVLRVEWDGTTLFGYLNGQLMLSGTPTVSTAGQNYAGLIHVATAQPSTLLFDNFYAGSDPIQVSQTKTDTGAISVSDASTDFVTINSNDTMAISVAEASAFGTTTTLVSGSETTSLSVAEAAATAVTVAATDAAAIAVGDTSAAIISVARTDTAAVSVADTSTSFRSITASDTAAITVTETASNGSNNFIPGTDTSALGVAEQASVFATMTRPDTSAITISESRSVGLTRTGAETAAITVTETSAIVKQTATMVPKAYVNGQWVNSVIKVYVGGQWKVAKVKRYVAGVWV